MYRCTILVYGAAPEVGTELILGLVRDSPADYRATDDRPYNGVLTVDNKEVRLDIQDSKCLHDFKVMQDIYMRDGDGFILVYAVDDKKSFDRVKWFHDELCRVRDTSTAPAVICGSHCEFESDRLVTQQEGEELGRQLKCSFFETSVRAHPNIENAFKAAVKAVWAESRQMGNLKKNGSCRIM
jgi:GTPase SAR1 family protein